MKPKSGIREAVEIAGGQRALSRATGISKSFINRMVQAGVASPLQCHKIHQATGVPLERLNPAVYRPPEDSNAA